MKNGNYFCKVNCPPENRGFFFGRYRDVLSRAQEFNTSFVSLPDGTAIGVSYLSAHPRTDRMIYRYDILWNDQIESQLKSAGVEFVWDETRVLGKPFGGFEEEGECIPSTDIAGAARISQGQGYSALKWGGA